MRTDAVSPALLPAHPTNSTSSESSVQQGQGQEAVSSSVGLGEAEEDEYAGRSRAGTGSSDGSSNQGEGRRRGIGGLRRPPSYSSDDGVSYVVEAQPRSIAPVGDVPVSGGGGVRGGRRLA